MISIPQLPRFRVPIQFRPGSTLYNLRVSYSSNPNKHILLLEQTVMELERELDALRYRDAHREKVLERLRIRIEELQ